MKETIELQETAKLEPVERTEEKEQTPAEASLQADEIIIDALVGLVKNAPSAAVARALSTTHAKLIGSLGTRKLEIQIRRLVDYHNGNLVDAAAHLQKFIDAL